MTEPGVLWIVQDGVLAGPAASQTVPYVTGLARRGFRMALLSFERRLDDRPRVRATREELTAAGVAWAALPYGRGRAGPRTAVQMLRGLATARGLLRRERVDLLHARSFLPALLARGLRRPYLFDMRGFWPRERVDAGLWPEGGAKHRFAGRLERRLLRDAAGVVVLAEGARESLPPLAAPLAVIPTAVDLDRFRPGLPPPPDAAELADREVYVVAGALGSWYRLDDMLDLLALACRRSSRAHALVLTEEDPAAAVAGLDARGVPPGRRTVRGVPWREVPRWFSLATAGVMLIESAPSKRASAPTKLGEFLASGVPVVITPGIGDSGDLVDRARVGVVVRRPDVAGRNEASLAAALDQLDALRREGAGLAVRCRSTAERYLSLAAAVERYASLYREIIGRSCV